ncbi:MAG: hypothetical protein CBR30_00495 [Dictyoglomus sp. NZ13-RE01]|nr:MAG: hypothetical protein CBR30_00495 [Dictyoglomus sp. NZ13-RE01]
MGTFEIVDLTLELTPKLPFQEEEFLSIREFSKSVEKIELSSITGTYIEFTYDEFPKDFLIREAVVLDITDIWLKDIITEARFENIYIEEGSGIILKSKWYSRWTSGEIKVDPPILSIPACEVLIKNKIKFLGTDFPLSKEARELLLSKDIILIHNLYNLLALKKNKVLLIIAPLNIKGIKRIPARVFALQ